MHANINIYRLSGKWYVTVWIDGDWDRCAKLGVADGASAEEVFAAAFAEPICGAMSRRVQLLAANGSCVESRSD